MLDWVHNEEKQNNARDPLLSEFSEILEVSFN